MAPIFDSTTLFNQDAFSDVTNKCGRRELKCHKVVLCHASDYFNAMFGPQSKYAESDLTMIEVQGDDPDALEAMLRFLYNFKYDNIATILGHSSVQFHLNVYVVAGKYLLPQLGSDALLLMSKGVADIENHCMFSGDVSELLTRIKILTQYEDHNASFGELVEELCIVHASGCFDGEERVPKYA